MTEEFVSDIDFPFTMVPTKIWEIGLTPGEMAVFNRILYRAGLKGQCFESRAGIAEACCLSERTVSVIFTELERLNIVQIIRRKSENKSNLIRLTNPAQWIGKRKIFPKENRPRENISQGLGKPFLEARENISHVTISNELDPNDLDNTLPRSTAGTPGGQIFEAYVDAYQRRYNIEPLRNAKTNAVCATIAKQLPLEEAKAIMHFYLKQNVGWYVQKSHAIEYALKDLQALRTNMMRNQTMSSTAAQQADRMAAQKQALEKFHGQNTEIDASSIFGGDLCESNDHRTPLKLLRPKD